MRRLLWWGLAVSSLGSSVQAQEAAVTPLAPAAEAAGTPTPSSAIIIPRDTPVELMAYSEVSTANAKPGQRFKLLVNRPISIAGRQVIPVGAPAYGEVISAVDSGGLGKPGKMSARLLHINLGGIEIPLEGETSAKGTGAGSAGVAVLFAGVAGLFHRGNNAKIKAGEIIAGFVAKDFTLDMSAATARPASGTVAAAAR